MKDLVAAIDFHREHFPSLPKDIGCVTFSAEFQGTRFAYLRPEILWSIVWLHVWGDVDTDDLTPRLV